MRFERNRIFTGGGINPAALFGNFVISIDSIDQIPLYKGVPFTVSFSLACFIKQGGDGIVTAILTQADKTIGHVDSQAISVGESEQVKGAVDITPQVAGRGVKLHLKFWNPDTLQSWAETEQTVDISYHIQMPLIVVLWAGEHYQGFSQIWRRAHVDCTSCLW